MNGVAGYLTVLARETKRSESEVMALAMETGLRELWREHQLGQYLRGELSRSEAIQAVGIDWVELAERQKRAVDQDLEWGLNP
jgi:hypothetical protein